MVSHLPRTANQNPVDRLPFVDDINRRHLEEYVRSLKLKNLKNTTVWIKVWKIYPFLKYRDFADLATATPADTENYYLARREEVAAATLQGDLLELKLFYRWLYPDREMVPFTPKKQTHKLPVDQLITRDEVRRMVEACDTQRDRALIMLMWDSGCRISEILSLNVGHVQFDRYGAVVIVDGKTDRRRIRLTAATGDLQAWINQHPQKDNPAAPLFITYNRYGTGTKRLNGQTVRNRLKLLEKNLNLPKSIHPHAFRHARLTDLTKQGFNEMELRTIAGWEPSSAMPAVYVHLSGADVEQKILEKAGILDPAEADDDPTLEARRCPRCQYLNAPDAIYCFRCSQALTEEAAAEVEAARAEMTREAVREMIREEMGRER